MKKNIILEKLYSLHRFGINPGLERITNILQYVDNPHNNFRSIHIAGTNGKGSTSSLLASILMEAGYNVGLYTSPHLINFNERIKVNGLDISDDDLVHYAEIFLPYSEKVNATFFEITTAMAFQYFSDKHIDYAIIETGMGGRFDATNVLTPLVSGITSISLEHKEYLGDTIEQIAYEKAGIIKNNKPVIVSKNIEDVYVEIKNIADCKQSKFILATESETVIQHKYLDNLTTEVCINFRGNLAYTVLPLPGEHQIDNLELVLSIFLHSGIELSLENIRDGIENVKHNSKLSTRIEMLKDSPYIIIDSSHNVDAVKSLVGTLKQHIGTYKFDIIFAAMADKDIPAILSLLNTITNKLIITKPAIDRAADINKIQDIALKLGFDKVVTTKNTEEAFYKISPDMNTLIVGSFYLTGEMLTLLNKI